MGESDEKQDPEGPGESGRRRAGTTAFFKDMAKTLGRTAGQAKDALARLGERGMIALAVRKLEREKSERFRELGELARKSLAEPGGVLRADDTRAADLTRALDRLDERVARFREEMARLAEGKGDGDLSEEGGGGEGGGEDE